VVSKQIAGPLRLLLAEIENVNTLISKQKQEAQLSQRDRAMLRVIEYVA